jgi:alanine racemase
MDQITIDVTDVPSASVGDDVVLIGMSGDLEQTADDVAAQEGTISYEVLTALLPRLPRVYFEQGEPVAAMSLPSGPRIVALSRGTTG